MDYNDGPGWDGCTSCDRWIERCERVEAKIDAATHALGRLQGYCAVTYEDDRSLATLLKELEVILVARPPRTKSPEK